MRLLVIALTALFCFCQNTEKESSNKKNYSLYTKEASAFCKKNKLENGYFLLADLGVHSGRKRLFLYDFKKDTIVSSYMVSHGCGDSMWGNTFTKTDPKISNEADSHCSSVGKYVIKERGVSQWGIRVKYLLYGKDKTNSNAMDRAIVLHSWEKIPHEEVYPQGAPEGWGCPAVSNEAMREIDKILKLSRKPVLLWIIK
ncbi:murein L,D-transpeptidase catalytic domain family protein [Flavobacterium amniphilum]|uniref:murein L,D-transpeptidase catalytic domain-containing protein n=1 Tax=Flavobacterium amniphilum TaxID=1834035 RepID=UPI00202A0D82|nr:murein L,D-transpeptidase catalytic domain family protein [Flavobacterium amniphilum]MCL9804858.1 murein L,D-transpeptidase catalytic domain family protein [Flavobacterium amniphilum]